MWHNWRVGSVPMHAWRSLRDPHAPILLASNNEESCAAVRMTSCALTRSTAARARPSLCARMANSKKSQLAPPNSQRRAVSAFSGPNTMHIYSAVRWRLSRGATTSPPSLGSALVPEAVPAPAPAPAPALAAPLLAASGRTKLAHIIIFLGATSRTVRTVMPAGGSDRPSTFVTR